MASKPTKEGLEYFSVDIDLYEDEKILYAQELIDPAGAEPWLRFSIPCVAIRLLREIYRLGYYIEWNDRTALTISSKMNSVITMSVLKKIVLCLVDSGFFSKEIYNNFNILTSHGIQKRWSRIIKMSKRKGVALRKDINIYSDDINISPNNENLIPEELPNTPEELPNTPEELPNTQPIMELSKQNNTLLYFNNNTIDTIDNKESINSIISIGEEIPEELPNTPEELPNTPEELPNTPENGYHTYKYLLNDISEKLEHPIEVCFYNYLNNKKYEITTALHFNQLKLSDDIAEAEVLLKKWLEAFNRSLINAGRMKMQMVGSQGSYMQYFPNWVNKVISTNTGNINPDILFTKKVHLNGMSVKKKKDIFKETLDPFLEKYGKGMLNDFFKHWAEPDVEKHHLRWELEKTWDVSMRLSTWYKKSLKFSK